MSDKMERLTVDDKGIFHFSTPQDKADAEKNGALKAQIADLQAALAKAANRALGEVFDNLSKARLEGGPQNDDFIKGFNGAISGAQHMIVAMMERNGKDAETAQEKR